MEFRKKLTEIWLLSIFLDITSIVAVHFTLLGQTYPAPYNLPISLSVSP